jgi:hypothetical protein
LTQYANVPIDGAVVQARVRFPDGSTDHLMLSPQGEGVYETAFATGLAGIYVVRITAYGRTLRGAVFSREALRTAAIWRSGDQPPPSGKDEDWCRKIECLMESGVLSREALKRLGIDIGRLSACCPPEIPEEKAPILTRKRAGE